MIKRLKIVSDGNASITRVYDADGNDVTEALQIREIVWRHRAGEFPRIEIISELTAAELIGDVDG